MKLFDAEIGQLVKINGIKYRYMGFKVKYMPTLGYMSANGNCLILPGFCPKIESGYTLSDILEEQVDEKYFLSEKAICALYLPQERKIK